MEVLKEKLAKDILNSHAKSILIHSDVLFALKIKYENRKQFLKQHIEVLKEIGGSCDLIFPSFNYDFCREKLYDINNDKSQIGALSEYFRTEATWRSCTPVFNFSGTGVMPIACEYGDIDPFSETSMFGFLDKEKALLLHYGSGLHTTTLLHYVESISKQLVYRYEKIFSGTVVDKKGVSHKVRLQYHVRPMGYELQYDWDKIERNLMENGIICKYEDGETRILLGRIDQIVSFWVNCLKEDPFYLLDSKTSEWVEKKYKSLKRPFLITDFE